MRGEVVACHGLPHHTESQVRRGRGYLHAGPFKPDRRGERAEQGRAAAEQDRDHVHADLVDQSERECGSWVARMSRSASL